MLLSASQCRGARAMLSMSQDELAKAAKVAKATLANFELGKSVPYDRTLADIQRALEAAGVIFVAENGDGPGVRLRKGHRDEGKRPDQLNAANDE